MPSNIRQISGIKAEFFSRSKFIVFSLGVVLLIFLVIIDKMWKREV